MTKSELVASLAALAQENRLDIYRYLLQYGTTGQAAGQIAEHLALPAATLSFHLKTLRQAGLLTCRRESRSLIYSPNSATMKEVVEVLTELLQPR